MTLKPPPQFRERQNRWKCWRNSSREQARFAPMSAQQAAQLWRRAQQYDEQTGMSGSGRHGGAIGRTGLMVLQVMLFSFQDFRTGRLDPSYAAIARRARCCVRAVASALQRLKELGILNWVRRCREDQDEKGRFCLRQESNAYALLPWSQWRGFNTAPPAPPPDPESWGAAPVLPTALEDALIEARQGGDQVAQLRRLEADPGDQLAAALASLFGSIAAAAQR